MTKRRHSVVTMALANLIGVESRAAGADQCADGRAFPAASDPADECATGRAHGSRQLIPVLLPESAPVPVTVVNISPRGRPAGICRMMVASVPRLGKTWHRCGG